MQRGDIPDEVKAVITKEKKFSSNSAFLKDKNLKAEYENRSYASEAYRQLDQLENDGMIIRQHEQFDDPQFKNAEQTINQREDHYSNLQVQSFKRDDGFQSIQMNTAIT